MERDRRGRDRRERRGEWESLAVISGEGRFGSLEERIRGLTERIEGLERGTWRMEEKKGEYGIFIGWRGREWEVEMGL